MIHSINKKALAAGGPAAPKPNNRHYRCSPDRSLVPPGRSNLLESHWSNQWLTGMIVMGWQSLGPRPDVCTWPVRGTRTRLMALLRFRFVEISRFTREYLLCVWESCLLFPAS